MTRQQEKQKARWDKRNGVRVPKFRPGDWVCCELMPRPSKEGPRFSQPRRIARQTGPASYRLEDGTRVHAEQITGRQITGSHRAGCSAVPDAGAAAAAGSAVRAASPEVAVCLDADVGASVDGADTAEAARRTLERVERPLLPTLVRLRRQALGVLSRRSARDRADPQW